MAFISNVQNPNGNCQAISSSPPQDPQKHVRVRLPPRRTDDSSLVSLSTEEDDYIDYYDTFVDECHEDTVPDAATCSLIDFCGQLL
mmetsp:Transcript_36467/g.59006  ORF Transcript_36467/g.59006 Transcript_36467/m.59006 type:complete len:86 (-) Transcript_36467:74-331(-)|eukprot:CAMPEP_0184656166 /NCGR_PEP_ID=MMETSP0308-20130426/15873_1 /TAXON_ID=38269 /ORGANISM="Gloeochaete witrockiana, Strain SAG 46.84" /LENGTH=85 /DNA_ID=CAMNT_0027093153 /DNA_START=204 /DNA_END=461 /DNA_ORIENTATION=+